MKAEDLRQLTTEEINQKIKDSQRELFNLRFQLATGQLKNYKRIKEVKKNIARLLTVLREKEIEKAK